MVPKNIANLEKEVKEIILPLKNELGITNFSYSRKYYDNNRLLLTTDPSWHNYLFSHKSNLLKSHNKLSEIVIWDYKLDPAYKNSLGNIGEIRFNRFHGMSLINKENNYIEVLGFSTSKENSQINHYYEYAQDIFYKFKFYFLDKAHKLIAIAEKNKITFPNTEQSVGNNTNINIIKNKLHQLTPINKLHTYSINGKSITITKKELECIRWLMFGKSSSEIALITGVGLTTINTHIKNIKEKIGLFKITQLIKFFCNKQFDCLYE